MKTISLANVKRLRYISNPSNGNVIINISRFKNINIHKKELDENTTKHYALIISKILIHELFGHKKSSYSKSGTNFNSIISFKDEYGDLKFISKNDKNNNIFKDPLDLTNSDLIDDFTGDSGYFIEFFLGKINGIYTLSVIDTIENKTYLSVLLNAKLWHKELSIFKEYIKLKAIFINLFPKIAIDNKLNVYDQITFMKSKIESGDQKEEINSNKLVINTIDKKFDDSLKNLLKKRKQVLLTGKETSKKEEPSIEDLNKTVFKGFTHGFYRK